MKIRSWLFVVPLICPMVCARADTDAVTYLSHEPASILDTGLINIRLALLQGQLAVGSTPIQTHVYFDSKVNKVVVDGFVASGEYFTMSDGDICKSMIGMIRQTLGINSSTLKPEVEYQLMSYFTANHFFNNQAPPADLEKQVDDLITLTATYIKIGKTYTNSKAGVLNPEIYISGPNKVGKK